MWSVIRSGSGQLRTKFLGTCGNCFNVTFDAPVSRIRRTASYDASYESPLKLFSKGCLNNLSEKVQEQRRRTLLPYRGWQQERGLQGSSGASDDAGLSRHYKEEIIIGYTPAQLYDVVAAVDTYQDFVPWCQSSTVLWQRGDRMDAELEVGFKFLTERYISHVQCRRPFTIKTTVSQSYLFDYLDNLWEFHPGPSPHSCRLHFTVDFQFRSSLYRRVANLFFEEVVTRMVRSFEKRCLLIYGPSRHLKIRRAFQQQS